MTAALFRLVLAAVVVAVLLLASWIADGWEAMRQAEDLYDVLPTDDDGAVVALRAGCDCDHCRRLLADVYSAIFPAEWTDADTAAAWEAAL